MILYLKLFGRAIVSKLKIKKNGAVRRRELVRAGLDDIGDAYFLQRPLDHGQRLFVRAGTSPAKDAVFHLLDNERIAVSPCLYLQRQRIIFPFNGHSRCRFEAFAFQDADDFLRDRFSLIPGFAFRHFSLPGTYFFLN